MSSLAWPIADVTICSCVCSDSAPRSCLARCRAFPSFLLMRRTSALLAMFFRTCPFRLVWIMVTGCPYCRIRRIWTLSTPPQWARPGQKRTMATRCSAFNATATDLWLARGIITKFSTCKQFRAIQWRARCTFVATIMSLLLLQVRFNRICE